MSKVDVGDRTQRVTITDEVAERVYRVLIKYGKADYQQRLAFIHQMSEDTQGLDQEEWRIHSGHYGVTKFFMCSDEWYVITSQEDESDPTRAAVNICNLELAKLRDVIDAEQNP